MYVVTVDGFVRRAEYKGLDSLQDAVGGYITAVGTLPLDSGYSCYVDDEGLLKADPKRNTLLEQLAGYQPLAGNGVLLSFVEGGEDHLLEGTDQERFEYITQRLDALVEESDRGDSLVLLDGLGPIVHTLARPLYVRGR